MRKTVPRPDELWVCHLGHVGYADGVAIQETLRERRVAGELPDTLLLLEHPPVYTRGRRSADGELALRRGLLPRTRHRRCADQPRRAHHLPRPRAARRLSDHARRRDRHVPAHDGGRDRCRARRSGHRRPRATAGRPGLHRRVGRGAQDRLDRRSRLARHLHARLRGQRRQRPAALLLGRRVRPAGRAR